MVRVSGAVFNRDHRCFPAGIGSIGSLSDLFKKNLTN